MRARWVLSVVLVCVGCGAGPGGGLVSSVGQPVSDRVVRVESVPADDGFWAIDGADRFWVKLVRAGRSAMAVQQGELVELSGTVVAHGPDFADREGVGPGGGADLLTRQGAHIEVTQADVRVLPPR
jgi:hypothetical protein